MNENQSAARHARRFLAEHVRSDWDWPSVLPAQPFSDERPDSPLEYRERYYGTTSGSESGLGEPEVAGAKDPYKFDSPDSIATAIWERREQRKRKRQQAFEDECRWNEGMAVFAKRRDVWTGAVASGANGKMEVEGEAEGDAEAEQRKLKKQGDDRQGVGATVTHRSPTTSSSESAMMSTAPSTPIRPPDGGLLIPIAKPMLASNAIRKSITPKAYPDIYNKVVLSSRTPSVPINLADMTKAIVQGWKDNGEWPPKTTPLDPLMGKRKSALDGVHHSPKEVNRINPEATFLSNHPHVKKGVESVKRVFRLSGSQGSGSSQHTPGPGEVG
jgi:hypothetical protein